MRKLITAESVTRGHPDKVCDSISDAILDELLSQDRLARVACETCVTTGFVLVFGEVTTKGYADVEGIARRVICDIGYNQPNLGFDGKSCSVLTMLHNQSADIAMGVDTGGAGDQGMMFGYATNETDELMPMPIYLAHKITRRLEEARKTGELSFLRPDGKSQVTVEYEGGKPKRIDTIVVSTQHDESISYKYLIEKVKTHIIEKSIDSNLLDKNTKYFINPTGKFVIGGPAGDSGLTGRKIVVDTYGGVVPHGGGAFSGKDPTKVDRSAAYMARYACKNLVASGLCDKVELQVSYAIGVERPVSMYVDTHGTGKLSDERLAQIVEGEFDFSPNGIIKTLKLRAPIYSKTSSYGHFGNPSFNWEKLDKATALKKYL